MKDMEQLAYDRPREKLQSRSVTYLTTTELIQVIIGSGTARFSGARLAKRISSMLGDSNVSMLKLCEINGIGPAKAAQVIAAIELGKRLSVDTHAPLALVDSQRYRNAASEYRKLTAIAYFYNGSHIEIGKKVYPLKAQSPSLCAQRLAKDALTLNARSVTVVLGSKKDPLHTTTIELDIIKCFKESLSLLAIKLNKVYRANEQYIEEWSEL